MKIAILLGVATASLGCYGATPADCEDPLGLGPGVLVPSDATFAAGLCLPAPLTVADDGSVECEVFELLAAGTTECGAGRAAAGEMEIGGEVRAACLVTQVGDVIGPGWFYESTEAPRLGDDVDDACRRPDDDGGAQRIFFDFQYSPGSLIRIVCAEPIDECGG